MACRVFHLSAISRPCVLGFWLTVLAGMPRQSFAYYLSPWQARLLTLCARWHAIYLIGVLSLAFDIVIYLTSGPHRIIGIRWDLCRCGTWYGLILQPLQPYCARFLTYCACWHAMSVIRVPSLASFVDTSLCFPTYFLTYISLGQRKLDER
jgi:hypothetical protein